MDEKRKLWGVSRGGWVFITLCAFIWLVVDSEMSKDSETATSETTLGDKIAQVDEATQDNSDSPKVMDDSVYLAEAAHHSLDEPEPDYNREIDTMIMQPCLLKAVRMRREPGMSEEEQAKVTRILLAEQMKQMQDSVRGLVQDMDLKERGIIYGAMLRRCKAGMDNQ